MRVGGFFFAQEFTEITPRNIANLRDIVHVNSQYYVDKKNENQLLNGILSKSRFHSHFTQA